MNRKWLIAAVPSLMMGQVLAELFTSEGCSSCPPADALLQVLDRTQPVPGVKVIVLSEHVDYWNRIGWKDPFSSAQFSNRQQDYAPRFNLDSVYTPQLVIDGDAQLVGSDAKGAITAIAKAALKPKVPVRIGPIRSAGPHALMVKVETDRLPAAARFEQAELFLVLADNTDASRVLRGENSGHTLTHVSVVRLLTQAGTVGKTQSFSKAVRLALEDGWNPDAMHVVAFLQQPGSGTVLGAAVAYSLRRRTDASGRQNCTSRPCWTQKLSFHATVK